MTQSLKRTIGAIAVIAGFLLFAVIIFLINYFRLIKLMKPADTEAINDSVWCIRDRYVNAYIFRGTTGYVMIDAGIGKDNFSKELEKTGIKPKKISAILLTNTDADHTGSIALFKNAVVYMNKHEEQMINVKKGKAKFNNAKWKFGPYTLLNDDEFLNIGGLKIRILCTPGHTTGSSCYIIGNHYLVSGDNFILKNGKYGTFTSRFNMNTLQQSESLKILPDPSSFKYILTGHNGIIKL